MCSPTVKVPQAATRVNSWITGPFEVEPVDRWLINSWLIVGSSRPNADFDDMLMPEAGVVLGSDNAP